MHMNQLDLLFSCVWHQPKQSSARLCDASQYPGSGDINLLRHQAKQVRCCCRNLQELAGLAGASLVLQKMMLSLHALTCCCWS
jgi:hypothetical protein